MQTTNSDFSDAVFKLIKTVGVMAYKLIAVLTVMAKRACTGEKHGSA